MTKHLTLADISANRQKFLPREQEQQVNAHLSQCRDCAALDEALAILGNAPLPRQTQHARVSTTCLAPETVANYCNGKYFFWRRWQIERHIAACAECRTMLADLIRLAHSPLNEEERAWVKTLPATKAVASRERAEPAPVPQWRASKARFRLKPAPAFALAFAAALLLLAKISWPEISGWQSQRLARQGFAQLEQQHKIFPEQLRPAGDFQLKLLSGPRGRKQEPESERAAEKFRGSLDWNAANLSAQRGHALQAYLKEEFEEAQRLLLILQRQYPASAEVQNDLAVVALALREPEQALNFVEQALARQPNFPQALFNRAMLLQQLHRREDARRAWQEYLQSNDAAPWHAFAQSQLQALASPLP